MSSFETYQNLLRINKHRLDDELELQADIMGRISDQLSTMEADVSAAENELKATEARLFRGYKLDDEKATDKSADSSVRRDPERTRAFENLLRCQKTLNQWRGLYDSWKTRGYSLGKLCDLYIAQYFTRDSHSISSRADRRRGEEAALSERRPYRSDETVRRRVTLDRD